MKYLKFLFFSLVLFSCTRDELFENEEELVSAQAEMNSWIYDSMDKYYLWYENLPEKSSLDLDTEPSEFFNSLLSNNDGKKNTVFSHMEYEDSDLKKTRSSNDEILSYGFEYFLVKINNHGGLAALVNLVYPNSPAMEAGLKRGDLILKVNGVSLNSENFYDCIDAPKSSARLLLGEVLSDNRYREGKEIHISSPRIVPVKSVYKDTVLHVDGRKIGYLMYNSFEKEGDDDLRMVSRKFNTEQIDAMVLDLRYNPGGDLNSAQLLGTLLAPQDILNRRFVTLVFNDKVNIRREIMFDKNVIGRGVNLDMRKLYVIVSGFSASASEAVVNGLKPYLKDELVLIGETTFGKNVGQILLENAKWPSLELWPTAFRIYNSDDFGDYANGIVPDYRCREGLRLGELGTLSDALLLQAINLIKGEGAEYIRTKSESSPFEIVYSSFSEKQPSCYISNIREK